MKFGAVICGEQMIIMEKTGWPGEVNSGDKNATEEKL